MDGRQRRGGVIEYGWGRRLVGAGEFGWASGVVDAGLRKSGAGLVVAACVQVGICAVLAQDGYPAVFMLMVFPGFLVVTGVLLHRLLFRGESVIVPLSMCAVFAVFSLMASASVAGRDTGALNVAEPLMGLGGFAVAMAGRSWAWAGAYTLLALHRVGLVMAGTGLVDEHITLSVIECGSVSASVLGSTLVRRFSRRLDAEEERLRADAERDARAALANAAARERPRMLHDAPVLLLWLIGQGAVPDTAVTRRQCADDAELLRGRSERWEITHGLSRALDDLVEFFAGRNLRVDVEKGRESAYPEDRTVVTTLVRVVHQALTNVALHSGRDRAAVVVEAQPGKILIMVSDDGVGFDVSQVGERMGFRKSIVERMSDVGGDATVTGGSGDRGTVVTLRWPR